MFDEVYCIFWTNQGEHRQQQVIQSKLACDEQGLPNLVSCDDDLLRVEISHDRHHGLMITVEKDKLVVVEIGVQESFQKEQFMAMICLWTLIGFLLTPTKKVTSG